ncbi:hypothetical protein HY449_01560 [Candidatus Pacearchaeota archaeon]|nr:hypothetical protein [Candidatus Pacearchaeota archaeon]
MAINLEDLTNEGIQTTLDIIKRSSAREKGNLIGKAIEILKKEKLLSEEKFFELKTIGKEPDYENSQIASALVRAYYDIYFSTYESASGRNRRSVQ